MRIEVADFGILRATAPTENTRSIGDFVRGVMQPAGGMRAATKAD